MTTWRKKYLKMKIPVSTCFNKQDDVWSWKLTLYGAQLWGIWHCKFLVSVYFIKLINPFSTVYSIKYTVIIKIMKIITIIINISILITFLLLSNRNFFLSFFFLFFFFFANSFLWRQHCRHKVWTPDMSLLDDIWLKETVRRQWKCFTVPPIENNIILWLYL